MTKNKQPACHFFIYTLTAVTCFFLSTTHADTLNMSIPFAALLASTPLPPQEIKPPYPPSKVIAGITWHWKTYRSAAHGSDLWPVTWSMDNNLYAAWGDGGGFGGTNQLGRVALGFARIEGSPENFKGININGGEDPEHHASFVRQGKAGSILAVGQRLFAWLNTQNGKWPNVDEALIWSDDKGATWRQSSWIFPKGKGNFKPETFLNFGKGYTGIPHDLQGYVYFYGQKEGDDNKTYLGRVPTQKIENRSAYMFFSGYDGETPFWTSDAAKSLPVFVDANPMGGPNVIYIPALNRYLLSVFHSGPGELGIFDSPHPWGPWTTVAYYNQWGNMGAQGEGLSCSFPAKWIRANGLSLWCIFSVYGEGAKQGIFAHDRFNLVSATLQLRN